MCGNSEFSYNYFLPLGSIGGHQSQYDCGISCTSRCVFLVLSGPSGLILFETGIYECEFNGYIKTQTFVQPCHVIQGSNWSVSFFVFGLLFHCSVLLYWTKFLPGMSYIFGCKYGKVGYIFLRLLVSSILSFSSFCLTCYTLETA